MKNPHSSYNKDIEAEPNGGKAQATRSRNCGSKLYEKVVLILMNGKTALGALLVLMGGWIVLKIIGVSLGPIIGFLFPFILMGLGYIGIKNDSKLIGGAMFAIGLIMLLGKLSGLFLFLGAIGLVVLGVSMFRGNNRRVY